MGTEVHQSNYVPEGQYNVERVIVLPNDTLSGETYQLDEKLRTVMVLGKPTPDSKTFYICQVCGKEGQSMQI